MAFNDFILTLLGRKKHPDPVPMLPQKSEDDGPMIAEVGIETKSFDWSYYNAQIQAEGSGLFNNEFNTIPTKRTIKNMYAKESFVHVVTQEVSRPFMNSSFAIERDTNAAGTEDQTIKSHPLLSLLNNPGSEPGCLFHANNITELVLTGDCILWIAPNKKKLVRIPSDKVEAVVENGKIVSYRLFPTKNDPESGLVGTGTVNLKPEEVVHIKLPNPYSNFTGLSMFIAQVIHILIDKYGHEFVVSFFLRGGNTSGIIETQTNQINQLVRLMKTIMQAFGSRRNMHADKILPQNAKWVGSGQKFSDIGLTELIRANAKRIASSLSVPPIVYGDSDSVNYSNAEIQMKAFWEKTICPLQQIYCAGLQYSQLGVMLGLTEKDKLYIDNSSVPYLSVFNKRLDEDAKLKDLLTVNERRERLGFEPFPPDDERGEMLDRELSGSQQSMFEGFSFDGKTLPAATETPQPQVSIQETDEDSAFKSVAEENSTNFPKRMESLLYRSFSDIEDLVLDNLESKSAVDAQIAIVAESFGKKFADSVIDKMMKHYDLLVENAIGRKRFSAMKTKDIGDDNIATLQSLQQRAKDFLASRVAEKAQGRFLGYTDNLTASAYKLITERLSAGDSNSDVASAVRQKFGEYYEGQAQTIVRTEYGAALGLVNEKVGSDLVTVSKRMSKTWMAVGDSVTRDSHAIIDRDVIVGPADEIMDKSFLQGKTLRFPNDPLAPAEESINCRCVLSYKVAEWK